jgi:hypothetical protein
MKASEIGIVVLILVHATVQALKLMEKRKSPTERSDR